MQNLIKLGLVSAAGLALPLAAHAGAPTGDQGISYNYLEAGYVFGDELDVEDLGLGKQDVDGWALKGSAEIAPGIFVRGSSNSLDVEGPLFFGDGSLDTLSLGVGYSLPLMTGPAPLDLWGGLSYERLDLFGDEADGMGADLGVRWMPIQGFELNAFGGWRDYGQWINEDLDGWTYGVGAVYHATQKLALTADWTRLDLEAADFLGGSDGDVELDTFSIGARWNF